MCGGKFVQPRRIVSRQLHEPIASFSSPLDYFNSLLPSEIQNQLKEKSVHEFRTNSVNKGRVKCPSFLLDSSYKYLLHH